VEGRGRKGLGMGRGWERMGRRTCRVGREGKGEEEAEGGDRVWKRGRGAQLRYLSRDAEYLVAPLVAAVVFPWLLNAFVAALQRREVAVTAAAAAAAAAAVAGASADSVAESVDSLTYDGHCTARRRRRPSHGAHINAAAVKFSPALYVSTADHCDRFRST